MANNCEKDPNCENSLSLCFRVKCGDFNAGGRTYKSMDLNSRLALTKQWYEEVLSLVSLDDLNFEAYPLKRMLPDYPSFS